MYVSKLVMSVDSTLEKSLSYPVLVILIIGAIIGTGIFFAPVLGAQMSGSSSIIAWFVMGILSLYIASCFAELTSMYPTSGGVYEFAKQAFGRTTSFFVGWMGQ